MMAMSGNQWYGLTEKVCAVDDWPLAPSIHCISRDHREMGLWDLRLLIPDLLLSPSRSHVSPHAGIAQTCSQTHSWESPAGVWLGICSFDNTL